MSGQKQLMDALDVAAAALLARHFPAAPAEGVPLVMPSDPEIQIKAFTACVNWYGPRTKLGGKDEETSNEFTRLRNRLHGRRASKRKASDGETEVGGGGNGLDAATPTEGSA